jgi:hypothetical protein
MRELFVQMSKGTNYCIKFLCYILQELQGTG